MKLELINQRAEAFAKSEGMSFHDKETSPAMWALYILGCLWIWNRRFLTKQTTIMGGRVYWPKSVRASSRRYRTILHEAVHNMDARGRGGWFRFYLLYLFPQCLAPFALLAVQGGPWLYSLVFMLAAAPWPAPWRFKYEGRAFKINLWLDLQWAAQTTSEAWMAHMKRRYVDKLSSFGTYYGMATPDQAREWFDLAALERIHPWPGFYAALWDVFAGSDPGAHTST